MADLNPNTHIKTIQEHQKELVRENIGKYLRSPWCFDLWYEKLGLIALGLLAMSKIWGWVA